MTGGRPGTEADRVDAVVVGGGIVGASCAFALAKAGLSVLLIEREPQFGVHATGRSAAMLSETSGPAPVRALAVTSRPFLEQPPAGFCEHELTRPRGLLWVADTAGASRLRAFAAEARHQVPDIELLSADEARALVPVLRPGWLAAGLWEPHARSLDVDQLLQGYLRALRRAGGTAHPGEGLLGAEAGTSGWRVGTDRREVRADVLVDAAGAWADDVARRCGVRPLGLVPYKRTAFTFAPPAGVTVDAWPLVMDHGSRFYVEPESGGLLASPAEETPVEPHDAGPDELDVARAVDALAEATTLEVRGVRRAWAGLRTFAPDRVPVVGRDPDLPSFCWAAGLGGYGIKTAPAVGVLVAGAVTRTRLPRAALAAGVDPAAYDPARLC